MTHLETIETLIEDWKRKDVDAVLAHLSNDITYYYAIGEAPVIGKDAMRAFLNRIKTHQNQPAWRIKNSAETETMVLIEAIDDYVNPDGIRVQTPHMTVYEFTNGKISAWRDYFDFGLLKRIESGAPAPDHLKSLLDA